MAETARTWKSGGAKPKVRADDRRGSAPGQYGQPPYIRNESDLEYIRKYACMVHHTVLAQQIGINLSTLKKYYADELHEAFQQRVLPIASKIWRAASEGDRNSQRMIVQAFGGWNNRLFDKEPETIARENSHAFAVDPEVLADLSDEEFALYERLCAKLQNDESERDDAGPESAGSGQADQGGAAGKGKRRGNPRKMPDA